MSNRNRKWIYRTPMDNGVLRPELFEMVEETLREPEDGEALVRVKLVNLRAHTRFHMQSGKIPLGSSGNGNYACAQVIKTRDRAFKEGDLIACQAGWQEFQYIRSMDRAIGYGPASAEVRALNQTNSQWTYVFRPQIAARWSPETLLSVFGTSGMTAYFGMRECGPLSSEDAVLVAATSGSVGSIAAQLAKAAGCRVVGLAGGVDRCNWVVDTLGVECLDYRSERLPINLQVTFPSGIDVFSDGVAGDLTQTVASIMNRGGRILSYGTASSFYSEGASHGNRTRKEVCGITPIVEAIMAERGVTSELWVVDSFYHERLEAEDALSVLLESGQLKPVCNVYEGFETLPAALSSLYQNSRAGKLQVRFA